MGYGFHLFLPAWYLLHLLYDSKILVVTRSLSYHAEILQNPESTKLPNRAQIKVQEFHTTQSLTRNLKIMPWKTKRHTSTRCMFGTSGNSHSLGWSKDQVSPLNHLQSGWSQMGMDRELYQTHKRDVVNTWNLNGMNICHIYKYINNIPKKTHAKSTA